MFGTRTFEAVDISYVLLVDDAKYKYFAVSGDADKKPFEYFLNPAVYGGGGTAEVRWTGSAWEYVGYTPSPLDDRYGKGANSVDLIGQPTAGKSFPVRPPMGSAINTPFFKRNGDNIVAPGQNNLRLVPAYETANIHPVLVLQVYEARLASYEYYTYLGDALTASDNVFLLASREAQIQALMEEWVDKLQNSYQLAKFYGAYGTAWKDKIVYEPLVSVSKVSFPSLLAYDGKEVQGERLGGATSGNLMLPGVMLPGLTKVQGHEYFGLKSMRGVYGIFARPEKISDLAVVAKTTVDTLIDATSLNSGQKAALKAALTEKFSDHVYDWYRGSESKIRVPDGQGGFKTMTVNVFFGMNTSYTGLGQLLIDTGSGEKIVTAMGVNLEDVFSYYSDTLEKAYPFPSAYQLVTGPTGSLQIVGTDNTVLGYLNDAYTR